MPVFSRSEPSVCVRCLWLTLVEKAGGVLTRFYSPLEAMCWVHLNRQPFSATPAVAGSGGCPWSCPRSDSRCSLRPFQKKQQPKANICIWGRVCWEHRCLTDSTPLAWQQWSPHGVHSRGFLISMQDAFRRRPLNSTLTDTSDTLVLILHFLVATW